MNTPIRLFPGGLAALVLGVASLSAHAHGDEPHGDEPHGATPVAAATDGAPRFEAATDTFEMVGRLQDGALTLFVNRFETGEPVLQAQVELESGAHKAVAVFEPAQGRYVVRDAGFVGALAAPGTHALVVSVAAGNEADLLDASLAVAGDHEAAGAVAATSFPPFGKRTLLLAGAPALVGVLALAWALRRRAARAPKQGGVQ